MCRAASVPVFIQSPDGACHTCTHLYVCACTHLYAPVCVVVQIHVLSDGSVHVFSRNQEDNTNKYPDIVHRMQAMVSGLQQQEQHPAVTSAVIDSEAVAWDRQQNCILPFQELSKRKRKVGQPDLTAATTTTTTVLVKLLTFVDFCVFFRCFSIWLTFVMHPWSRFS